MAFISAAPVSHAPQVRSNALCRARRVRRAFGFTTLRCSLSDDTGDASQGIDNGAIGSAEVSPAVAETPRAESNADTVADSARTTESAAASSSEFDTAAPDLSSVAATSSDVPFEVRGFSLANVFLYSGLAVTLGSLTSYLGSSGSSGAVSSLGFVYGVPIALVGAALKYAELKPVALQTNATASEARKTKSTDTLRQVVKDITRHRYGDESHMQPALSALGLIARGQPCPKLINATELVEDGEYALELDFISLHTPYARWKEQVPKYEQFFGPGIRAETIKLDEVRRIVRMRLIAKARL